MMVFPWHQSQWQQLMGGQALHHGLMLTGLRGVGKWEFCVHLARFLLCNEKQNSPENQPCGECQSCELFQAGTHPDFHVLTSELENVNSRLSLVQNYGDRYQNAEARDKKAKPSKIIPIHQIRQLIDQFSTSAHIARHKVALIAPADCLNINASNALLKLLEEPPEGSTLILMTPLPGSLPATIRSRCMVINLRTPDSDSGLKWLAGEIDGNAELMASALEAASGGPLEAKRLLESGDFQQHHQYLDRFSDLLIAKVGPLELASDLAKADFPGLITWLSRFVGAIVKWKVGAAKPGWFDIDNMPWASRTISVEKLFLLQDRIHFYQSIAREPINVQLALEDLLMSFATISRR